MARNFSLPPERAPSLTKITPSTYLGLSSKLMVWLADPGAFVEFTCAGDACYVLGLARGTQVSGSVILATLRKVVAQGLRIEVVGATRDSIGFYGLMVEREIIDDFTEEDVEMFFELD